MEIQRIQVLAYNPKVNGIIKRSYEPIKNALSKIKGKWIVNLPVVLFADQIITNASTNYMPFYWLPVFLVEQLHSDWKRCHWKIVTSLWID